MIPEAIYKFNIYDEAMVQQLGSGGELTLPDLQAMTSTVSGSGLLGEIDSPLLGMFSSIEFEIPYRILNEEGFKFMKKQAHGSGVTIRGAQQVTNMTTHAIEHKQMRVVIRGRNKGMNLGKMKQGESMDSAIKLEVTYILIEVEGKKMLELDKFNTIFIIDGEDQLVDIRRMC